MRGCPGNLFGGTFLRAREVGGVFSSGAGVPVLFVGALELKADPARDEDLVAELTLPMVVISGLVEDPELDHMRRQPKLMMQLARQIPEILTEIYLFFHAPRNV